MAARPRLTAVQCQKRDGGARPVRRRLADYLHEEKEKAMEHYREIISVDDGCLYAEATEMSARVCLAAKDALVMASHVMHSAELNLAAPNEVSAETIHRTVRMYVNVFLAAADDSYHRKVSKGTVASFLGALRGLAAVSHILLEDAMEAVSHRLPRDSLSEYAFNSDVKDMYAEFERQMSELECEVRPALAPEMCKMAFPIIVRGTKITATIVMLMVDRRKRALEKAHGKMLHA
ncbi:hypothetical protein E2562_020474 [Oryza meyeriana var. granulata]|uniref:Uncharacterized protein n=1 Tax=Oryza meyeriana var. granulata TaxID=110450 RepID=A0A6G1D4D1_9ORYZ|nr:hypothetical protein E2562_020474 [Oryza meyeriana var. granulata]